MHGELRKISSPMHPLEDLIYSQWLFEDYIFDTEI